MTDITELAQSLKRRATSANEFGESLYVKADDVLALVEALASEKRICATWRKTAEANSEKLEKAQQRIAELESRTVTVKLPNQTQFDDPLSAYEAIEKCKEALTAQGIKWEAE